MSSYFDRNLAKSLRTSLERDDIKSQASRINGMMTAVSLFVQKLQEAKDTVSKKKDLENELTKLKRGKETTPEASARITELSGDIQEITELERQINKSKSEVNSLISAAKDLNHTLSRL